MATHARQQYFADESSLSKEKREFSIAEEVQQKIDSIEEGAQVNTIETIKVNGSEVQPDENKAVDLTIPGVVDSLDSTSSTDALSAKQGKVLYDYIQDVSHIGHFLALWDASTGLPVTDPETSPYIYNTGDFYTVSVVASGGGTNYKPNGTQYVIGQASTAVDTDNVEVNDFYFYDGATWRHMKNSGAGSIAVDGSLSTTSTNPVENRVITNALNNKANATDVNTKTFYLSSESDLTTAQAAYDWYLAGKNPLLHLSYDSGGEFYVCYGLQGFNLDFVKPSLEGDYLSRGRTYVTKPGLSINANYASQVTGITVWPQNRTVGRFLDTDTNYSTPYTPQYPGSPATKKYVDDHAGVTYTAGANIQISAQNVISSTDTKYTAGTGISIDANNVISNTQTSAEWGNITGTLSDQTDLQNALDGKVNLGINKVFDNTVVKISKWEQEQGSSSSGHNVTIDPNGEVSTYNVTTGGHNEATLGSANLTLLESSALGGNETTVISQDGITITEGQTTQTYNFLGNDRIAKLSDISGLSNINLKSFGTFPGSGLSDLQDLYDWLAAGNYGEVTYGNQVYIFGPTNVTTGDVESYVMRETNISSNESGVLDMKDTTLTFAVSDGTVTGNYGANSTTTGQGRIIYVNSAAGQPSSPQTNTFYYDTTNKQLKVYDGTSWNEVGKEYTDGNGINIDANNEITNTGVLSVNGQTGDVTVNDVKIYNSAFAVASEGTVGYFTTDKSLAIQDGNGWTDIMLEPYNAGSTGDVITKTASGYEWQNVDRLPTQTGNNGKFLQTNGTTASWQDVNEFKTQAEYDALPATKTSDNKTYFIYEEEA